jgi:hypothetical protein
MPMCRAARPGCWCAKSNPLGSAQNNQTVEEYAVDTALLKELRAHEQQAAQELGQWLDKHEHTGKDGESLVFTIQLDKPDDDSDSDAA